MKFREAVYNTIKDRGVLKWEAGSFGLYVLPAVVRIATHKAVIPILNAPYYSPSPFIPSNLVEQVIEGSFWPGGAGGVAGETLIGNLRNKRLEGKSKYLARLAGAYLQYGAWTAIEYAGWLQHAIGPHGDNYFDPPQLILFKLGLATMSIFTPYAVEKGKSVVDSIRRSFKRND